MKSARLTHRLVIYTAQQNPKGMEQVACDFMELMQQKVAHMNPEHVLNMDQTPIPFLYHNKCMWDKKGVKTVLMQSSTSETKRATLVTTVTMSVLPPLLIFKSKKMGGPKRRSYQISHLCVCMPSKKGMDG